MNKKNATKSVDFLPQKSLVPLPPLPHVSHGHEGIPRCRLLSQPGSKPLCLERNFISVLTFNRGLQACEQDKQNRYTQRNVELVTFYCSIFTRKPENTYIPALLITGSGTFNAMPVVSPECNSLPATCDLFFIPVSVKRLGARPSYRRCDWLFIYGRHFKS